MDGCLKSVEAIEANGVVTEQPALFIAARAFNHPVDDFDPLRVGSGEFRDMPVAAKHDAVEPEDFDRVGDVWPELLARPVSVIGLGHHAGDLAMDVRHGCKLAQMLSPGVEQPGLDPGLADMVEDKADLGALPDHPDHVRHLMMVDADVEGEIVGRQQLQAGDKVGTNAEFGIGPVLDQAPDGTQDLVAAKLFKLGLDCLAAFERQGRDHAGELRRGGRQS